MTNNRENTSPLLLLYRILIVIASILTLIIIGGTFLGTCGAKKPPEQNKVPESQAGLNYFTGIGRIRAASNDIKPASIIVSIAFPYDRSDSVFSEELASRVKDFRDIAIDLFSSYSASSLRDIGEEALKTELLRRYNKVLKLGNIGILYFNDYLVVD